MPTLGQIVSRMRAAGESEANIAATRAEYERINQPAARPPEHEAVTQAKEFLQSPRSNLPRGNPEPVGPTDFWGGVAESFRSGEALEAGVEGLKGFGRGAVLDLPSTIVEGVKGIGTGLWSLADDPVAHFKAAPAAFKEMGQAFADTVAHAGSDPHAFGRMTGQLTGQPLVTEALAMASPVGVGLRGSVAKGNTPGAVPVSGTTGLSRFAPTVYRKTPTGPIADAARALKTPVAKAAYKTGVSGAMEKVGGALVGAEPSRNIPITPKGVTARAVGKVARAAGEPIARTGQRMRMRALAVEDPNLAAARPRTPTPTAPVEIEYAGGGTGADRPSITGTGNRPRIRRTPKPADVDSAADLELTRPIFESAEAAAARRTEPRSIDLEQPVVEASRNRTTPYEPNSVRSTGEPGEFEVGGLEEVWPGEVTTPRVESVGVDLNQPVGPSSRSVDVPYESNPIQPAIEGAPGEFVAPGDLQSINLQEPVGVPSRNVDMPYEPTPPPLSYGEVDLAAPVETIGVGEPAGPSMRNQPMPIQTLEPPLPYGEVPIAPPENRIPLRGGRPARSSRHRDMPHEPNPVQPTIGGAPGEFETPIDLTQPIGVREGGPSSRSQSVPYELGQEAAGAAEAAEISRAYRADRAAKEAGVNLEEPVAPPAPTRPTGTPPPSNPPGTTAAIPESRTSAASPPNAEADFLQMLREANPQDLKAALDKMVAGEGMVQEGGLTVDPRTGEIINEPPKTPPPSVPTAPPPAPPGAPPNRAGSRFSGPRSRTDVPEPYEMTPERTPAGPVRPTNQPLPARPKNPLTPEVPEGQLTNRDILDYSNKRAAENQLAREAEARRFADEVSPAGNEFSEDMLFTPEELAGPDIPEFTSPFENPYDPRITGMMNEPIPPPEVPIARFETPSPGKAFDEAMARFYELTEKGNNGTLTMEELTEAKGLNRMLRDMNFERPPDVAPYVKPTPTRGVTPRPNDPVARAKVLQQIEDIKNSAPTFEPLEVPIRKPAPTPKPPVLPEPELVPTPRGPQPKSPNNPGVWEMPNVPEGPAKARKWTVETPDGKQLKMIEIKPEEFNTFKESIAEDIASSGEVVTDADIYEIMVNQRRNDLAQKAGYSGNNINKVKVTEVGGAKPEPPKPAGPVLKSKTGEVVSTKPATTQQEAQKAILDIGNRAAKMSREGITDYAQWDALEAELNPHIDTLREAAKSGRAIANTEEIYRAAKGDFVRVKEHAFSKGNKGKAAPAKAAEKKVEPAASKTEAKAETAPEPKAEPKTEPKTGFNPDEAFKPDSDPLPAIQEMFKLEEANAADAAYKELLPNNRRFDLSEGETYKIRLEKMVSEHLKGFMEKMKKKHGPSEPEIAKTEPKTTDPKRQAAIDQFVRDVESTREPIPPTAARTPEIPLLRMRDVARNATNPETRRLAAKLEGRKGFSSEPVTREPAGERNLPRLPGPIPEGAKIVLKKADPQTMAKRAKMAEDAGFINSGRFDEYGNPIYIKRDKWTSKVKKASMENWIDPDID